MTTERDAYVVLHVSPEAPQDVVQAATERSRVVITRTASNPGTS